MASNDKNLLPQKPVVQQGPHILVPRTQPSASGSTMPQNYRVFVVPPTQLSRMGLIAKNENGKIIITQKPGSESRSPNTSTPLSISIIKTDSGDSPSVITVRKNVITKEGDHCREVRDLNVSKDNMVVHLDNTPVRTPRPYFARRTSSRRLLPQFTKFWKSCLMEKGYVKCPLRGCNFICLSYGEMTMHYYNCKGEPFLSTFVCTPCNGRLKSEEDLKTHLLRTHTYTEKTVEVPKKKELPKPEEKPAAWTRKRAYSRVHKVSWNIALGEKGYVNCLFKNCCFLALDLQQMIQHYGICNGTTAASAVHCPYCVACAESIEKLKAHIMKSHFKEGLPASITVRPVAHSARDTRIEVSPTTTSTAAAMTTTTTMTTTTRTDVAATTGTATIAATIKTSTTSVKSVSKVRNAKSAKRDITALTSPSVRTSASKAVQTSFTVLDIPSYPVDHSESGLYAESGGFVEAASQNVAEPEVHRLYGLYEDHEEQPVLDTVESPSNSQPSRLCYSEGRMKSHSRVYTKDYKRSIAVSPGSRLRQPSPVPCLYADDFSLCSDTYGLPVVETPDSKVKSKVLVVTENPEKSVVQKLQAYVSHCNANKSYVRGSSSSRMQPGRTAQQDENDLCSTNVQRNTKAWNLKSEVQQERRVKYEIFSDDEPTYPLDYSSDSSSVAGRTLDESQINLNISDTSQVSAEPIIINEGYLSESCASSSLVSYTDDMEEYIIPEVVEMPQYIVPSSVEFCHQARDAAALDCRKEANYSKPVPQVPIGEKKTSVQVRDVTISQKETQEVIRSQTVGVIAPVSQGNDASKKQGAVKSYLAPLVKFTAPPHPLFADTHETEDFDSVLESEKDVFTQCSSDGGDLQKPEQDIDVCGVNVETVTILDPRLMSEASNGFARKSFFAVSGQDLYSRKRVEQLEADSAASREKKAERKSISEPDFSLQKGEESREKLREEADARSDGIVEESPGDAEDLISLGTNNKSNADKELLPHTTPPEMLTESKINVVVDSDVNIMSISEDCENYPSLKNECYEGNKFLPTNTISGIEEVLCEQTIQVRTDDSDIAVLSVVSSMEQLSCNENVIKVNLQETVLPPQNRDERAPVAHQTPVSDDLEMSSCVEGMERISVSAQGIVGPTSCKEPTLDTESIQLPLKAVECDKAPSSVDSAGGECGRLSPFKILEGKEQESAKDGVNTEPPVSCTKLSSYMEVQSEMIGSRFCSLECPHLLEADGSTSAQCSLHEVQRSLTTVGGEVLVAEREFIISPDKMPSHIEPVESEIINNSEKCDIPLTSVLDIPEDQTSAVELKGSQPEKACETECCVKEDESGIEKADVEIELVPAVNERDPVTCPLVSSQASPLEASSAKSSCHVLGVLRRIVSCPPEDAEGDKKERQIHPDIPTTEDPRPSDISNTTSDLTHCIELVQQNLQTDDLGVVSVEKTKVSNSSAINSSSSAIDVIPSPEIVDNEAPEESYSSKDVRLCEIGQKSEEGISGRETAIPLQRSSDVPTQNVTPTSVQISPQDTAETVEGAVFVEAQGLKSSDSVSEKEVGFTAVPSVGNEVSKDISFCVTRFRVENADIPEQEETVVALVPPVIQEGPASPGTSQILCSDPIECKSDTRSGESVIKKIQVSELLAVSSSGGGGGVTSTTLAEEIPFGSEEQRSETEKSLIDSKSDGTMLKDPVVNIPLHCQPSSLEPEKMEEEEVLKLPLPDLSCKVNESSSQPSVTEFGIGISEPNFTEGTESSAERMTCSVASVIKMGSISHEKLADDEVSNACSRLTQLAEIASCPSDYQNKFAILDKNSLVPETSVTQIEQEPHEHAEVKQSTNTHLGVIQSGVSNEQTIASDFEPTENESTRQETSTVLPHVRDELPTIEGSDDTKATYEPCEHSNQPVIVCVQVEEQQKASEEEDVGDKSPQNVSSSKPESVAEVERQLEGVGEEEPIGKRSDAICGIESTCSDEIHDKSQGRSSSSFSLSPKISIASETSENESDSSLCLLSNVKSREVVEGSEIKEIDKCEQKRELEEEEVRGEERMENDVCSHSSNREENTLSPYQVDVPQNGTCSLEQNSQYGKPERLKGQDADTSVSKSNEIQAVVGQEDVSCSEELSHAVTLVEKGPSDCSSFLEETSFTERESSKDDEVSIAVGERGELKEDVTSLCTDSEVIKTELEESVIVLAKKSVELQGNEDGDKMKDKECGGCIQEESVVSKGDSIIIEPMEMERDEDDAKEEGKEKLESEEIGGGVVNSVSLPGQNVCQEAEADETTGGGGEGGGGEEGLQGDSVGIPKSSQIKDDQSVLSVDEVNDSSTPLTPEVKEGNILMEIREITGNSEEEPFSQNVTSDHGKINISLDVSSSFAIEPRFNVSSVEQPEKLKSPSNNISESRLLDGSRPTFEEPCEERRCLHLESEVGGKSPPPTLLPEQDSEMMECTKMDKTIQKQLENLGDGEAEEVESNSGGVDEINECDLRESIGDHDIYSHENIIQSSQDDPVQVLEASNFRVLDSPKITNSDKKIYSIQDLQDILEGTDDSKPKLDVDEMNLEKGELVSSKDETDSVKYPLNDSLKKSGKACEYPERIPIASSQENKMSIPQVSKLVLDEELSPLNIACDSDISQSNVDVQNEIVSSPLKKRRHSTDCVSMGARGAQGVLTSDACDSGTRKRMRRSGSVDEVVNDGQRVRNVWFLPSVGEEAADAVMSDSFHSSSTPLNSPFLETQDLLPAIPQQSKVPMDEEAKSNEVEECPESLIASEGGKKIIPDPNLNVQVEVEDTQKRRTSRRKRKPKSYADFYEGDESPLRPAKRARRSRVSALLNEEGSSNSSEGSWCDLSERKTRGRSVRCSKRNKALENLDENSTSSEALHEALNEENNSSAKGLADESKEDILAFDSEVSTMSEDSLLSKGVDVSGVVSEDSKDGVDLQEAAVSGSGGGKRGRRGSRGRGRGRGRRGRGRGGRGSRGSSATRDSAEQDGGEELDEEAVQDGSGNEVQCGKCQAKFPKSKFERHNIQAHNGLGWLEGQPPVDMKNEKQVLSLLWKTVKSYKKSLICERCGVTKKSAVGFYSHIESCNLSLEERESLKMKCTVCGRYMISASLKVHMQTHKFSIQVEEPVDTTRVKRAAAEKASSLMQEVIKEEADFEDKRRKNTAGVEDLGDFYKRVGATRPCNPILYKWKSSIATDGIANCLFPGCTFQTPDISTMMEHFCACDNRPKKGFRCDLCNFLTTREADMKKHLAQEHINAPDPESDIEEPEVIRRVPTQRTFKICNKLTFLATEYCGTVHGDKPFIPAAKWTYKFWCENYSLEDLFPDYHTTKADWSPLSSRELKDYLPNTTESISFSTLLMREEVIDIKNRQFLWKKLNLFESEIVDDVPTLFAGGPVWAVAWCVIPALKTSDQYLAVSCLSGMDDTFQSSEQILGKGLIQLWNFGPLDNLKRCSQEPKFVLGLAHDFGVISDLQWCPSGCFNETTSREDCLPRLGLLAAACSDGCIHLFSVCLPSSLDSSERFPIFKCKPVMTLKTCENPLSVLGNVPWNCLRLSWYKGKGHRIIAGGFTNGVVALWDIKTQSSFLRDKQEDTDILLPYKSFQAHYSCVTALSLAPQDEGRYLMSGSYDSTIKVWDLENFSGPIPPVLQKGMVTDGEWLTHWLATVTSYDDVYSMGHCNATLNPPRGFGFKVYPLLPQNSVAWALSSSDWINGVAQCTHAGELTTIFPHQLVINVDTEKGMKDKRIVLSYVELVDNLQKSSESSPECDTSCCSPCEKHPANTVKSKIEGLRNSKSLSENEKIVFENEDTKDLMKAGPCFVLERNTRKAKFCVIRPFTEVVEEEGDEEVEEEEEEEAEEGRRTVAGRRRTVAVAEEVSESANLECISMLDPQEKKLLLNFKKDLERLNVTSKLKVTFPYHNNAKKKSNSNDTMQEFLMIVGAVQEPSAQDSGITVPEKTAADEPSSNKACDEYNEIKDRFGMIFCHFPTENFSKLPYESRKWMRRSETMRTAPVDMYPITSLNKVKWNPNFRSFLWLASGYQCGLLRVPCVSGMHNQQVEHILKGAARNKVLGCPEEDS